MSQKRSEILEQVLRLLHMHTAEKFTMKNVADHLHLSKSSLYEYFPNKATMITDAILQMMEENQALIETIENPADLDFESHLTKYLEKIMEHIEKNRMMQQMMFHPEISILPPVMKLRVLNQMQITKKKLSNHFTSILDKGVKEKKLETPINPWKVRMVESMLLGVMMERSHPTNTWKSEEVLIHLKQCIHEIMAKKR
jgi:AcrR family transcriptional regulator